MVVEKLSSTQQAPGEIENISAATPLARGKSNASTFLAGRRLSTVKKFSKEVISTRFRSHIAHADYHRRKRYVRSTHFRLLSEPTVVAITKNTPRTRNWYSSETVFSFSRKQTPGLAGTPDEIGPWAQGD